MSQHHRLVDFGLPEPGAFLTGGEDLHGDLLAAPFTPPHLSKTPLADTLLEDDGPRDGPLDQQGQTWWKNQQRSVGNSCARDEELII